MTEPLLSVRDLSIAFRQGGRETLAVDRVSFDIGKGETLALVGESGSGKSVTALSILKLLPYPAAHHPTGSIIFKGQDFVPLTEREMRRVRGDDITIVFQEPMTSLNPLHTIEKQIGEILSLHRGLSGAAARARTLEVLTQVGIPDPRSRLQSYPHQLSGGQRQRVMIAMALANAPDLLIADEPTTALDVTVQAQILELLKGIQERLGMSLLFITHDLGIVRKIAQRVCVMTEGKIVEQGTVEKVFAAPQHPYTRALLAAEPKPDPAPPQPDAPLVLETADLKVWFPIKRGLLRKVVGHIKAVDGVSVARHSVSSANPVPARPHWASPSCGLFPPMGRSSLWDMRCRGCALRKCGRSVATCRSFSRIPMVRFPRGCRSPTSSRKACRCITRT